MFKKIACATSILLFSNVAISAGTSRGNVTWYGVVNNGYFLFASGDQSSKADCSDGQWAVNLSTVGGKAIMAAVLLAVSQDKPISVTGTGTCDAWADRETALLVTN